MFRGSRVQKARAFHPRVPLQGACLVSKGTYTVLGYGPSLTPHVKGPCNSRKIVPSGTLRM